jgi:hypothetical protein
MWVTHGRVARRSTSREAVVNTDRYTATNSSSAHVQLGSVGPVLSRRTTARVNPTAATAATRTHNVIRLMAGKLTTTAP